MPLRNRSAYRGYMRRYMRERRKTHPKTPHDQLLENAAASKRRELAAKRKTQPDDPDTYICKRAGLSIITIDSLCRVDYRVISPTGNYRERLISKPTDPIAAIEDRSPRLNTIEQLLEHAEAM